MSDSGRSPSGPGLTVSAQSVPNAVEAVRDWIASQAGVTVHIDACPSLPWQSLTFAGTRYQADIWADDTASALRLVLARIPDAEFDVVGSVVADVTATDPQDVPTYGGCQFIIELLTVDD